MPVLLKGFAKLNWKMILYEFQRSSLVPKQDNGFLVSPRIGKYSEFFTLILIFLGMKEMFNKNPEVLVNCCFGLKLRHISGTV